MKYICKLSTLLILILIHSNTASAYQLLKQSNVNLKQVSFGDNSLYSSPDFSFRSSDSSLWLLSSRGIVRKQGEWITNYEYPGLKSDYFSPELSPLIRAIEFKGKIILSINKQMIYFDQDLNTWLTLNYQPKDDEIITGLQVFQEKLWYSTIKGLYFSDEIGKKFSTLSIPKHLQHSRTKFPLITELFVNNESKSLWIGSYFSTLFKVSFKDSTYQFDKYTLQKNKNQIVHDIKQLDNNTLLIGSSIGLLTFNLSTNKSVNLTANYNLPYIDNIVITKNDYWFISEGKVYFYNKNLKQVFYISEDTLPFKTKSYTATSLYKDFEENIWITLTGNGLIQHNPYFNKFRYSPNITRGARNLNLLFKNKKDQLMYSFENKLFQSHTNDTLSIDANSVTFHKEKMYVGENGLVSVYQNQKKTDEIIIPGEKANISSLTVDKMDQLWIIDVLKGLFIYSLPNKQFINTSSIESKGANQANYVTTTNNGDIVVLTSNQINRYSILNSGKTKLIESVNLKNQISKSHKQNNHLMVLHPNNKISKLDLETFKYQSFQFSNISEDISCALTGEGNNWWLALKNGNLVKLNNESKNEAVYSQKDGIPMGGVNGNYCLKFFDSYLFSTHSGVIETNQSYISPIDANNKTHIAMINSSKGKTNHTALNSELELSSSDFPMQIDFYSSSLIFPQENQFRYRLNETHKWQELENNSKSLIVTNLKPGSYNVELQSRLSNYEWSQSLSIRIKSLNSLWLSWWAILIYLILLLSSIYFYSLLRVKRLKTRALKLEKQVQTRTSQLNELINKKNEEFANISHEFRTPLTIVLGSLQQLISKEKHESKKSSLQTIKRNSSRLLRMVDQILHLEKFRVQRVAETTYISVKPISEQIGNSFKVLAEQQGLKMQIGKIDDAWLYFTPDSLERILLNLLSNALKYSNEGDTIKFSIEKVNETQLKIIVEDSGIGIPNDKQEDIFKRFNRVLNPNSESIIGAGIGLSLVKELVEYHNGTIDLDSTSGKGSKFTVNLPLAIPSKTYNIENSALNIEMINSELENIEKPSPLEFNSNRNNTLTLPQDAATILIVEDNPDMRQHISNMLSSNYHTITAINGEEGFSYAKKEIPDLILSDVMMPQMDGFELCEQLKSNELTSHIPLILLTARADRKSRITGWKKQADDYQTKPFDNEELIIRIQNLLDIRALLKDRFLSNVQANDINIHKIDSNDPDNDWELQQSEFFEKFIKELEKSYANSNLKVAQIASSLAMTERQLYRKLKGIINQTPAEYLKNYRLEKAIILVKKGIPAGNISFDVGFSSHSYFSKCFKAKYGNSPSDYQ